MADYPSFFESTRYGYADGLKGVSCRHDFFGIDPEVSKPTYSESELNRMAEEESELHEYEAAGRNGKPVTKTFTLSQATQEMRKMERKMERARQEVSAYKAAGLNSDAKARRAKYYAMRLEYEKFCVAMDLDTNYAKVYQDGLGRV